jgi:hypothetical protein
MLAGRKQKLGRREAGICHDVERRAMRCNDGRWLCLG